MWLFDSPERAGGRRAGPVCSLSPIALAIAESASRRSPGDLAGSAMIDSAILISIPG